MTDDWILSVADVIETLGCLRNDVLDFLERGELQAARSRPLGIAHSEICRFADAHRREALQWGVPPLIAPDFALSRPRGIDDRLDSREGDDDTGPRDR